MLGLLLLSCAEPESGSASRLIRLTSTEWEATTAELLKLPEPSGISAGFVTDATNSTFDNNAADLSVNPLLWQQYQAASGALAALVIAEENAYVEVTGRSLSNLGGDADRDAWIAEFGRSAFRRTLSNQELKAHRQLFNEGSSIYKDEKAYVAGIQHSIDGFLQSPNFLYRVERTRKGSEDLTPLSFASRLSFALWNAHPDSDLLDVGEGAETIDEVRDEIPRLLEDRRTKGMVLDLHRQLFHVENYTNIPRPFVSYEDYSLTPNAVMQLEVDQFVASIVFSGGTLRDLFLSRKTVVDEQTAELYGIEGIEGIGTGALTAVELDPTERSGLLTMVGFLRVTSNGNEENLIRRSAFIHEALLCSSIPPPPPEATQLPPQEGSTQRDRIENHTSGCGGSCHTDLINPIAYAFGQYDGGGRYREDPEIDTSSTFDFTTGPVSFDGVVELSQVLAEQEQVHHCYVKHLAHYIEGRPVSEERIAALTTASMQGRPILDLIRDVVDHEAFQVVTPD